MPVELQVFIAIAIIHSLYYLVFFARLNLVRPFSGMPEYLPPASIIICARNEAENLKRYLKVVLIQQYKQYEVIVVNDQSTDNTIDVLVDFYLRNKNLKIVDIKPGEKKPYEGKKYALMKGIEVATFDTIVVTDADCRPASTMWLGKLVGAYMNETQIVLGHAPYEKQPGLLNKLIRYENFMAAMQCFGYAKAGIPYMGVGRNLSYSKGLFKSFGGFDKAKHLPTGDDDLLVNATATRKNTEVCIDKDAFVYTRAETTFAGWINQKRRHLRSGFKYRFYHVFLLFLFSLSLLLLYAAPVYLLVKGIMPVAVLGVLGGVLLLKLLTTFSIYRKLGEADLITISPLLDIAYTVYLLIIFFLILLKPKKSWT